MDSPSELMRQAYLDDVKNGIDPVDAGMKVGIKEIVLEDLPESERDDFDICESCDEKYFRENSNADDIRNFCSLKCQQDHTEAIEETAAHYRELGREFDRQRL